MNVKTSKRKALFVTLVTTLIGLGAIACSGEGGQEPASGATSSELRTTPFDVTCTSDCSATGGASITKSGCTTCSATNGSVTCDGATTYCATCTEPPPPHQRCSAGWHWCGCPDPNDPLPRGWKCGVCE